MIEDSEEFIRLTSSDDPKDRSRASTDEADVRVWLDVLSRFPEYADAVAANKTIPEAIINSLAESEDWRIRATIAAKRKIPVAVMLRLAKDVDEGTRLILSSNRKAPSQVLRILLSDPWTEVGIQARERLDAMNDDWVPLMRRSPIRLNHASCNIASPADFYNKWISDDPNEYSLYRYVVADEDVWSETIKKYPRLIE